MTARIHAEMHSSDTATVYYAPHWIERLVGRRTRERVAVRSSTRGNWRWLDGGEVIGGARRALDDAYRDAVVARSTAPTG